MTLKNLLAAAAFVAVLLSAAPALATISTPTASVIDAGNGATTAFTYNFLIPFQSNGTTPAVSVYLQTNSTGAVTLLSPSAYTITGTGNPAGGTIIYPLSGSPLSSSYSLVISRAFDYTQTTAVSNQAFYPHTVETTADKLDMQIQQLAALTARGVYVAPGSHIGQLPNAGTRANQLFGFDNAGDPLMYAPQSGGIVFPIPVSEGGTGATTSAGAKVNLNLPFFSPLDYGDHTCSDVNIQSAIAAAAVAGGVVKFTPSATVCSIAANVLINSNNVVLSCDAQSAGVLGSTPTTGCLWKWTGASGGTMLTIAAPTGTTANKALSGNGVLGITFDGNAGLAASAILIQSSGAGEYGHLFFSGFNGIGINHTSNVSTPAASGALGVFDLTSVHNTTTNFATHGDPQMNFIHDISMNQEGFTSDAMHLGTWIDGNFLAASNASMNTFENLDLWHGTGNALVMDGADNNVFINVRTAHAGGSPGYGLWFRIYHNAGGYFYAANSNMFYHASPAGDVVYADGQTAEPTCLDFTNPATPALCTNANVINGLDALNGTAVPTIETGAFLDWGYTTGFQAPYFRGQTAFGDNYNTSRAALKSCQTANCTVWVQSGNDGQLVLSNNTAQWIFSTEGDDARIVPYGGTTGRVLTVPFVKYGPYGLGEVTCNSGNKGAVGQANDLAAPIYGNPLVAGGAIAAPIYCNGTAWQTSLGLALANGALMYVTPEMFGAVGDDVANDTTPMNAAVAYVLAHGGQLALRQGAAYKVTSTITIDIGTSTAGLASDGFKILATAGSDIDGQSITGGPTLKILCTGVGAGCNNVVINDRLTVKGGYTAGPVIQIGAAGLSDSFVGIHIDYLIGQNYTASANGKGIQINQVSNSRMRLETYFPNSPASGVGVQLENANRNIIEVAANNGGAGAGAYGLLIENATNEGNTIVGLTGLAATCIRITSANAMYNTFVAPAFAGCTNAASSTAGHDNVLLAPDFTGVSTTVTGTAFTFNGILWPQTAPASPASGWQFYTDVSDGHLKAKASTGTVVDLGTP